MKKKTILRSLIALVLALVAVFTVTAIAAEYTASDGMTFEIVTSKQEYGVNEEVQVILLAKNYNTKMKLANISWDATVPGEELTMLSGEVTGTQVVEVGERAVINFRLMKIVETEDDPNTDPDATEPTTPDDSTQTGSQDTDEAEAPSAGSVAVLVILIVLALAGIGGIVWLLLKRRGVISCIALLLSLGLMLPCIPAVDVSAVELNLGDMVKNEDNTLSGSVKFIVDGKEYEATATMTYEMAPQTETVVEAMHSSMSQYEWTEYKTPTVVPTIGEHPRLNFTKDDIPEIIETLESDEASAMSSTFYRYLGVTFNGNFGSPSSSTGANFNSTDLASIRAKALYYALYKDSENAEEAHMALYYGQTAVRAIQKALETAIFNTAKVTYYYDIGDMQCAAAEVYDWCYDLLDHETKQNIARLAVAMAATNEAGWPVEIGNTVSTHTAGNQIQTYWLSMAIAMYDEYPTFYEYIGGAYFEAFIPPRDLWYVSQTHHQGSSYGVAGRGDCDMTSQMMIYKMTGGDNDRDGDGEPDGVYALCDEAGLVGYQLLYMMRPDGQLFREGDVWEENQTDKNEIWNAGGIAVERLSSLYKNGYYRRIALEMSNLSFSGTDFFYALVTHDPDVESTSYYNLPYTRYFPTPSGSMIARTGWDMGTDSNDVIVKMGIQQVYLNNHQHQEAGAFQIYYKGILASDSGYYTLYNTTNRLYYSTSSIAHNTLSITSVSNRYGEQTLTEDHYWGTEGHTQISNTLVGHEYGPNVNKPVYSYLAGDIGPSYDSNVQEAVRSMLFLNLELDGNTEYPGAFIVFDQITTSQVNSKKSFLLHMQQEPEIDGNTVIIKNTEDDYNGQLTDQVLYIGTADKVDENYTIEAIGGPNRQFVIGNYNYALTSEPNSALCQESGWGRVEISTTTTEVNQTDYMLNVMYVSDADGSTKTVPATLIYDGKGVIMGAQLMGHVAMFNMDGNNRISKEVSFTIPADSNYKTFKVNVAGLKAGTWTVYVNGKSVGTQVASEDGGMIYFEAAAGTVKLVRTGDNSNKTFDETPNTDEEPIGLMINGMYYYTDAHPVVSGEDYLVPVSIIFEALNGKGEWNRTGTVYTVNYKGKNYEFTKSSIKIDGEEFAFNEIREGDGDLLVDMTTAKKLIASDGSIYYDSSINKIRVNVTAQTRIPDLTENILNLFPNAVQVEAVIDNGYSTLPLADALDGDTSTRWCTQEKDNNISEGIFDLGSVVPLTEMVMTFMTESSLYSDYIFDVYVSTDGVSWIQLYENARSGEVNPRTCAETWVTYLMDCEARYVKIVGHGRYRYSNSGKPPATPNNTWLNVTEVIFLQKAVIDPDGAEIQGSRLQAEAECFHMQDGASVVKNNLALGKEEVQISKGYSSNPGTVSGSKPQLYATIIPKVTGAHTVWVRVNTSKVTSGDTLWVNIEGVTGNSYYAEKVNVGKKDSDGYLWIKLGQYEAQVALANWEAGKEYKISVISGCKNLIVDCFIISSDPSYVPYDECYSKKTAVDGSVTINGKDAIYEYSNATSSGNDAVLQKVSADGSASQAYIDYVLNTKNLPGDISANVRTNTSGVFSVYATVKVGTLANDRFFYSIAANDSTYKYKLFDLSEQVAGAAAGQYVTVKLGEIEMQASESLYVRIKGCSEGVVISTISTTCEVPTDVFTTTNGKTIIEAEDTTLAESGTDNVITVYNSATGEYDTMYTGDLANIVDSEGASGGKAVQMMKTYSAWNKMITYTTEPISHISFRVMPDKSGEYYIWLKVYAPEGTGIYAYIDGGDDYYYWRQPLNIETYSADEEDYIWVRLSQECRSGTTLYAEHFYNWTARRIYTVNLRSNKSGVKVDQIMITNSASDAPHNHTYATTWSANDTHHWYELTCGCTDAQPRKYGEHFFEDHTDKYCNTCGHTNPNYAPHNYADGKCTICGGLAPFTTSNGKLTLEAENLMLAADGTENHIAGHTGSVIKVVQNEAAEGGAAAQFTKTNSGWNHLIGTGTTPIPHLSVLVTPDKTGEYYIWVKVYAPYHESYKASVYCYIEGGSDVDYWRQPLFLNGYSQDSSDYFWVRVSQEYRTDLYGEHTYNWTAGQTYALRFRGYLNGSQIDQIYITNDPNDIPHNHTYSTGYEMDDTYHWRTATCGHDKTVGKAVHTYDNLLDQTCNDCGYVRAPHEHTYRTDWSTNATQHWHECACGAKADVGDHTYNNDICTVCSMHRPYATTDGKVTIEAENTTLAAPGTENLIKVYNSATGAYDTLYSGSLVSVKDVTGASGGKAVRFDKTHSGWNELQGEGLTPISHMAVHVTPDKTGEYYIWVKVYVPTRDDYNPAIYAYIDGGNDTYYWRQPIFHNGYSQNDSDYIWVRVYQEYLKESLGQNGADKVYNWSAGETYTIRFRGYLSGTLIDQIYITNDANDVPHNHSFSTQWSQDDTYHWHEASCEHTDLIRDKAEHTYDNLLDQTCNDCGYVRPAHVHAYSQSWSTNASDHWHECACGEKKDLAQHNYVNDVCDVCNVHKPYVMENGKVVIEAEDGILAEAGDENYLIQSSSSATYVEGVPVQVEANSNASGTAALKLNWQSGRTWQMMEVGAEPNAHATYRVQSDVSGQVYIWLKVYTLGTNTYKDGICCLIEDDQGTDTYYWRQALAKADGTFSEDGEDFYWVKLELATHNSGDIYAGTGSRTYTWTAGETYTLRFRSVSKDTLIDQIYITTDANDPYVKNHEHTFSADWSGNATYHWHAATCGHDDKTSDRGEHIYDDDADTQCNTCGAVRVICDHTYTNGICTLCGGKRVVKMTNGFAVVEAEDAVLNTDHVSVVTNANASGAEAVNGHTRNDAAQVSGVHVLNGTEDVAADVQVRVIPDADGTYYIWVRTGVRSAGGGVITWVDGDGWTDDSTGGSKYLSFNKTSTEAFVWQKIAVTPEWTAGNEYDIKLAVWSRDTTAVFYDCFVITNDPNYTPS